MDIYRVRAAATGSTGGPWMGTWFFDSAAGTPLQAATAVRTFLDAIKAQFRNSITWTWDAVVDTLSTAGTLLSSTAISPPANVTGTGTGDMLPPATQGRVIWQTGTIVNGRRLVGRTFIPGMIAGTQTATGAVQPATITAVNTAANALATAANCDMVVWSRAHATAVGITSGAMDSDFSVLRSRRD